MAGVETDALLARARRAYERGRLRRAAFEGLAVMPLVAGLVLVCPQRGLAFVAGALLYPVVVVLRWRGQAWGRAVWSGLAAGSIPILASLVTLSCAGVCPVRAYRAVCLGACVGGGLAAGIVVGLRAARQGSGSGAFLAAAGMLVALVGVPACGFAGVAGGFGLLIGATAGAAPFVLRPLRTPGA